MSRGLQRGLFAAYCGVSTCALVWPVYPWVAEQVHVSVLGLPFPFAWTVGWVCATFVALALYHSGREKE